MEDDDLIAAIRGTPAPKAPAYSQENLSALVSRKAAQYGIPEDYAQRWAGKESGWDHKAVSKKGAAGLVQLMPDTAKAYGVTDVNDPEQNVDGGARYLADLHKKYGSWDKTFAAYNAGPTAVDKADGVPDFPETQDYVKHIVGDGTADAPGQDIIAAIRGEAELSSQKLAKPTEGATTVPGANTVQTKDQEKFFKNYGDGKMWDQLAPVGSAPNPYAQVAEGDVPDQPGAYYVSLKGKLERVPGGPVDERDVKMAYDSGDHGKAAKLLAEMEADTAGTLGHGLVSGALLGGKNEARSILGHPVQFATNGGMDAPVIQSSIHGFDAQDAVRDANHPNAALFGKLLGAAGGGLALSAATGGTADAPLAFRVPMAAIEGGGVGGAQGFLASDGTTAERLPAAKEGLKLGALLGPGGEVAGDVGRLAANKLLGVGVSPETAALAKAARDEHGIKLRGGQIADSHFAKFMDSVLNRTPGTGYAAKSAQQSAQFTRAVAKTFGEDADGLTPEVMQRARTRIGGEFDRVGAATTVKDAKQLGTDLDAITTDAAKVLPKSEIASLKGQVRDIKSAFKKDASGNLELSGESYQALTRKGTPLDRLTKSGDPNVRHYAEALKDELLNAVQRNASADDVAALKTARSQWAKMKTLEPLAEKAGPEGEISPALLLQAMRTNYDNLAYDGGGSLGQLAKIGQRFLKEPPSSGTAERLAAQKLLGNAGLLAGGGGALWIAQHPEEAGKVGIGAGLIGLGTLAAGKGAALALDNPAYRALLLRSAGRAAPVVRKPLLLSAPTAAQLTSPILGTRNPVPAAP